MLSSKFRPLRSVLGSNCTVLRLKLLFSRTMASSSTTDLLINDPKYSWLKELGLQADNPGVFDGTWHASGPVSSLQSICTFYSEWLCIGLYQCMWHLNFHETPDTLASLLNPKFKHKRSKSRFTTSAIV